MTEYIIEWSGIGARIVELIGSVPACLIPKRLREERLREEIVRCRDCKHYEDGWCHVPDGDGGTKGWYMGKPGDGFCSEAERRES